MLRVLGVFCAAPSGYLAAGDFRPTDFRQHLFGKTKNHPLCEWSFALKFFAFFCLNQFTHPINFSLFGLFQIAENN